MDGMNEQYLRLKAVIDRARKPKALIYYGVCCGTFSSLSRIGIAEFAGHSANITSSPVSFELSAQIISNYNPQILTRAHAAFLRKGYVR